MLLDPPTSWQEEDAKAMAAEAKANRILKVAMDAMDEAQARTSAAGGSKEDFASIAVSYAARLTASDGAADPAEWLRSHVRTFQRISEND